MKKILPLIAIATLSLAIVFWYGKTREIHSAGIFVTDVLVELKAEGGDADHAFKKAADEIRRVDARLGYQNSLIDELNRKHVIRDREVYGLVRTSREVGRLSSGAFSLTLRPILDAWGFSGTHEFRIPSAGEFAAWKSLPGDDAIVLGHDGMTVQIPEGAQVDIGGTLEGYAADRARGAMKACGIDTGLVTVGGEVLAFGDRVWKVGVKNPRGEGVLGVIPLKDKAIATSGDYERFFTASSKRYCHILDPSSGWPVEGIMSASVIAPSCTLANAWAVALFVGGPDKLGPVLDRMGFDWIVVDGSGKVRASRAMQPYLPYRI